MDPSTVELLLAQDGDRGAFGRLIRLTEGDVRRFCRWQGGRVDVLDDLVQETYIRAFRGLASYRAECSAKSWLLSIARRVCLDHFEKIRRDASVLDRLHGEVLLTVCDDVDSSGVEVAQLIQEIPDVYQEAFALVRILGFSYDEAGVILGCPRGTIQSRVARARALLARTFTESISNHDSVTLRSRVS